MQRWPRKIASSISSTSPCAIRTASSPGIFVEGIDVTEAHFAEIRQAALVRLSDRVRDCIDPEDIEFEAARLLGETLGASRAGYGSIDRAAETISIERDWSAPGVKSLAGVLKFRDTARTSRTSSVAKRWSSPMRSRTCVHAAAPLRWRRSMRVRSSTCRSPNTAGSSRCCFSITRRRGLGATTNSRSCARSPNARAPAPSAAAPKPCCARTRRGLRFLDTLGSATAQSREADDILSATTRMLGEHLHLAICAYADMDADQDGFTIRGDWSAAGSSSIVGRYRLVDFGPLAVTRLRAGRPLVVNDIAAELASDDADAFQRLGIAATICMPLVKQGRLTALMAVHDKVARRWSATEFALVAEVAERSWAHIERVSAEAELRANEEQFRTLAQAMLNHVWTATPDGELEWLNDQTHIYSGVAPGLLDGAGWRAIVHADDLPAIAQRWRDALESSEFYEAEFRLRRFDGQWRWHLTRAVPVRDDAGRIMRWIGTNTDIQDQKEAAAALENLNATLERRVEERTAQLQKTEDALRHAHKMEAVGQLTGGLAHDFNNLLQGIAGSIDRAQHRIAAGRAADAERFLDTAMECAERAAALTHRLLAFSRRQTLDPRPTDVNRLIAGMEELIRRTMGPAILIEVVGAGGTVGDEGRRTAARERAAQSVHQRTRRHAGRRQPHHRDRQQMARRAHRPRSRRAAGQYVSLRVSDNGSGMTPDIVARAFDPFFTTKPLGQGTGLGLSMIYGFVRQSGGQVRIYTEVGHGTTMCLYLPRYVGQIVEPARVDQEVVDRGFGETVLVVEDEASVRMLVAEALTENHYPRARSRRRRTRRWPCSNPTGAST